MSLRYARSLDPHAIFILSAKYGLLSLDTEIEPYDITLSNLPMAEVRAWAQKVVSQLRLSTDLEKDHFIFLAGQKYRKFIIPHLVSYEAPLEGMRIGKQLQWLSK